MKQRIWILALCTWLICIGTVAADDTDIFGDPPVSIAPNVLIIFDTSGSMTGNDIPANPYVPATDYTSGSAGYTRDAVYRWSTTANDWTQFVAGVGSLDSGTCSEAIDELNTNGLTFVTVNNNSPYDCSSSDPEELTGDYSLYDLRMGNQLNYETGGYVGDMSTRTDVAKEVVKNLIDDYPNVRYGIMEFNYLPDWCGNAWWWTGTGWWWGWDCTTIAHGGKLVGDGDGSGEIQDYSETRAEALKTLVDGLPASGATPLAEALAEAGLYYAGDRGHFDSAHYTSYTSPIDIRCRPNYIILMTDGDTNSDNDAILGTDTYMLGQSIGDTDADHNDTLDDVAGFLFNNDLMPSMGTGDPDHERQNVITHTIGFRNSHPLLRQTADAGGGMFFTASSAQSLAMAFDQIMGTIETGSQIYVTPSVPVSRANGVYAGNSLYIGLFRPDMSTSNWRGNLKKYRLSPYFENLLDADNLVATDADGYFLSTSRSFWSTSDDGDLVDSGGAGEILANASSRNLYTYIEGTGAVADLTNSRNAFTEANTDLTSALLAADDATHRANIIKDIRGYNSDDTRKEWVMGDVLHSAPQVVLYDTDGDSDVDDADGSVVYVSTNGGVLHAFWDRPVSGTDQVSELWGFVPPPQLDRLKLLSDASTEHRYFLDGPPAVYSITSGSSTSRYLAFGERRGGKNYYVLDITDHDEPAWQFDVNDGILTGGLGEPLGYSFGRPQNITIATGSSTTADVLLLPGGYDLNQDNDTITTADTMGRGVFTVSATSGALANFAFYDDGTSGNDDMDYAIVDVIGVDTGGNGVTNSIYAPDLGGNMFAFTDGDHNGSWNKLRLFDASSSSGTDLNNRRKIFYAPDIIKISGDPYPTDTNDINVPGEMIFFGTGDRGDPEEVAVDNRFYAVKNYWWGTGQSWDTGSFSTMTESNLHDATDNHIVQGTAAQKAAAESELENRMGWFIELEQDGEKIVGSPVVFNGVIYFTTYAPPASGGSSPSDDCDSDDAAPGNARLYGLDYRDGRSVHPSWSDTVEDDPETGDQITRGGKADRWRDIGYYMPSPPVIAIHGGVARLYVGADSKLLIIEPEEDVEMNMYYWRDNQQ